MAPTRRRSHSASPTALPQVRRCLIPLRLSRRLASRQPPPTRSSLMAPERRRGRSASHTATTPTQILPDGWSSSPRRGSPVDSSAPLANPIKVRAIGGGGDGNMPSGKHAPLPSHLLKFLKGEGETARGDEVKLVALVVHALFLDNGFVSFDSLQHGSAASVTISSLELRYTLPSLLHLHPSSVDSIDLRFETWGKLVCISGRVPGNVSSSVSLVLDTSHYGIWKTMYLWEDLATLEDDGNEEEVREVLKMIKDRLLLPLHIDICDKAGLPSPPCFMRLPTDIQIKILELLPWSDLAKMACVCSEMKELASDDELWKQRYGEVLGEVDMAGAGETRWKRKFGASMWKKKMMEIDMAERRVSFYGPYDNEIDCYISDAWPWLPDLVARRTKKDGRPRSSDPACRIYKDGRRSIYGHLGYRTYVGGKSLREAAQRKASYRNYHRTDYRTNRNRSYAWPRSTYLVAPRIYKDHRPSMYKTDLVNRAYIGVDDD